MKQLKNLALVAFVFLAACAPTTQDGGSPTTPQIAIVNAPTEARIAGLAEALQQNLSAYAQDYGFIRPNRLRWQESHRDMYGSRAPLQAAFIARATGAEATVMVGVVGNGLQLVSYQLVRDRLFLDFVLSGTLRVGLVDPKTADIVFSASSQPFTARVTEKITIDLPKNGVVSNELLEQYVKKVEGEARAQAIKQLLQHDLRGPLAEVTQPLAHALEALINQVAP